MTEEPRHKFYGTTISEMIGFTPSGLDDEIGVGLGGIIDDGRRGFGLDSEALVEFVRKSLRTLVKAGARPWQWGTPNDPDRDIPLHYGSDTPDEIVEGVIADWLASGGGSLEWSDFRFILPEFTQRK